MFLTQIYNLKVRTMVNQRVHIMIALDRGLISYPDILQAEADNLISTYKIAVTNKRLLLKYALFSGKVDADQLALLTLIPDIKIEPVGTVTLPELAND